MFINVIKIIILILLCVYYGHKIYHRYLIRDLFYRNINNFQVITNNVDVEDDTPRAFNLYRNRKLLSHGLMDVALFSANANQLRYVLEGSDGNAISVICVALLLISILLQVST